MLMLLVQDPVYWEALGQVMPEQYIYYCTVLEKEKLQRPGSEKNAINLEIYN